MDKLFEKSIKTEKGKLKNLLDKLKASIKNTKDYDTYYKQKNAVVDALYKSGVKNIMWNNKTYSLLGDINRRNKTNVQSVTQKGVVKYDEYNKNLLNLSNNLTLLGSQDVNSDIGKVRDLITTDIEEIKTLLPSIDTMISNMVEDFSNVGLTYKQLKKVYDNLDSSETGEESKEESDIRKIYNGLKEEEKKKFMDKVKGLLNRIYKFFKPKKKKKEEGPETPTETETNLQDKDSQSGEPGVQPEEKANPKINPNLQKNYKVNDIVTITTQAHNIDAVYMGLVGEDVQDALNKLNTKFDKSDPFEGVFVMVRNTLPEIFANAKNSKGESVGIDILTINENLIGQEQLVRGYTSSGQLTKGYHVTLKSISLKEVRSGVEKIAASKLHNIEGTLLEKINSKEFKECMTTLNERVNIMKFESKMESDFIEVNESREEDYWVELGDFEAWYTSDDDLDGQKEAISGAFNNGDEVRCKELIKVALEEVLGETVPSILVQFAYEDVEQIG